MKKRIPEESQATKEVSPIFTQDDTDGFEDWLNKDTFLHFGFNAPSCQNTCSLKQHSFSVIATKSYIQKVKEKSTPTQNDSSSDSNDSGPGFSSKNSINPREVSVQEKNYQHTSTVHPASSRLKQG